MSGTAERVETFSDPHIVVVGGGTRALSSAVVAALMASGLNVVHSNVEDEFGYFDDLLCWKQPDPTIQHTYDPRRAKYPQKVRGSRRGQSAMLRNPAHRRPTLRGK